MRSADRASASTPGAPRPLAGPTQALVSDHPGRAHSCRVTLRVRRRCPVDQHRSRARQGWLWDRWSRPKNPEILPVLRSLTARGLLSGDGPFTISEGIAHVVTLLAAREGRLEHLAACATITSETIYEYHGRYPREVYSLDGARALQALSVQSKPAHRSV